MGVSVSLNLYEERVRYEIQLYSVLNYDFKSKHALKDWLITVILITVIVVVVIGYFKPWEWKVKKKINRIKDYLTTECTCPGTENFFYVTFYVI